jgi:hypothetical protein
MTFIVGNLYYCVKSIEKYTWLDSLSEYDAPNGTFNTSEFPILEYVFSDSSSHIFHIVGLNRYAHFSILYAEKYLVALP